MLAVSTSTVWLLTALICVHPLLPVSVQSLTWLAQLPPAAHKATMNCLVLAGEWPSGGGLGAHRVSTPLNPLCDNAVLHSRTPSHPLCTGPHPPTPRARDPTFPPPPPPRARDPTFPRPVHGTPPSYPTPVEGVPIPPAAHPQSVAPTV